MESVQQRATLPARSGLAGADSVSSGSKDGDGFYPKTPKTAGSETTEEVQMQERADVGHINVDTTGI